MVLRPLAISDAADLFAVYSHPDAMQYWHTPAHASIEDTHVLLQHELDGPAIQWVVCLPVTGQAIGVLGYLGTQGVPGMGYILHPDYWRRGYITEAMHAVLDYGFSELGIDRAELWIVSSNVASRGVAVRLGFTYRGCFQQKYVNHSSAHENVVYGLHKREWQHTPDTGANPRFYSAVPILPASDVQATAEYYRDMLGFTIDWLKGDPPTYGQIARGEWTADGVHLHLFRLGEDVNPCAQAMLYIFVSNVDALYAEYVARQVDVVLELAQHPWGMREFRVRDINGTILRFGEPG